MKAGSVYSIDMINSAALESRAVGMKTGTGMRVFNRFYRLASTYITEKYRVSPSDSQGDERYPNKIWWSETVNGETVKTDSLSVGEFILKSLEGWNPEKGMSYTSWVQALLKTYGHLVPATKNSEALSRKYREEYSRYCRLAKDNPKLTFGYYVNEYCSYLSFEKRQELILIKSGLKSFDDPVKKNDKDNEESVMFGDTVSSDEGETIPQQEDEEQLLEDIRECDEIMRMKVKSRKGMPKVALFLTVALIKKHIRYFDFDYYRGLVGRHECISDLIDTIEAFYLERKEEGKEDEKDLFPNQKEQAQMLGITPAGYNQILQGLKSGSDS